MVVIQTEVATDVTVSPHVVTCVAQLGPATGGEGGCLYRSKVGCRESGSVVGFQGNIPIEFIQDVRVALVMSK